MTATGAYETGTAYAGAAEDREWRRLVWPPGYRNPQPQPRYHLAVIGAGPAGLVTAIAAAGLGAKVALIERRAMGGDCLNVGCVPSKALLEHTRAAASGADFAAAFEWLRTVRARIAVHDSVERYRAAGVDVFLGSARFADERTLEVGGERLLARRIVIATGSRPALPPIAGLADARPLTNETVFDLRERPRRLAILGGGPIGCELAQAFARLAVTVEIVESADRVLPSEAPAASRRVAAALEAAGVRLRLGARVTAVARHGASVMLEADGAKVAADELLVATGRQPNTEELNLGAVGVEIDDHGAITVDRHLRTSNPRIYAAGDVCSALKFTHNADAHARICVQNALFFRSASTRKLVIPRCTYTDPEVAQVGPTRAELERSGVPFAAHRIAFGELDRGRTQGDEEDFAEVLAAPRGGRILAATIVGRDAGEQLAGICIAMANGIPLGRLAGTVLPYPTRSEYLRRLADQYNRARFTPLARRLVATWLKWRA